MKDTYVLAILTKILEVRFFTFFADEEITMDFLQLLSSLARGSNIGLILLCLCTFPFCSLYRFSIHLMNRFFTNMWN